MRENSQRDTFIFYRSFKESMNELSDADKLIMYEAISDYIRNLMIGHKSQKIKE